MTDRPIDRESPSEERCACGHVAQEFCAKCYQPVERWDAHVLGSYKCTSPVESQTSSPAPISEGSARDGVTLIAAERARTPFPVEVCHGGRDVWHVDDQKHKFPGPMKRIGKVRYGTLNFYECVSCSERAWVGLDSQRRIIAERESITGEETKP
jgi:hypothetical protein